MAERGAEAMKAGSYSEFKNSLSQSGCDRCPDLCAERTHIVVDRGNPGAKLVLIGEGPGEKEDLEGRSFVGRSGQLLDKIMGEAGIDTNQDALILNVVKCRPPKNRPPNPAEAQNCFPYLKWQLDWVKPRVVVLLGATAAKHFLPKNELKNMKDKVGRFFELKDFPETLFQVHYHPAYILRDPRQKSKALDHARVLRKCLEDQKIKLTARGAMHVTAR